MFSKLIVLITLINGISACIISQEPVELNFNYTNLSMIKNVYDPFVYYSEIAAIDINIREVPGLLFANFCADSIKLSSNELESIPTAAFEGMIYLGELWLNQNRITSLDSFVERWTVASLYLLDLSGNQLHKLTSKFGKVFENLLHLNFKSNEIEFINDRVFENLANLASLSLSYNRLKHIANFTFTGLINLEVVVLNNNFISNIDYNGFNDFYKLRMLFLENNQMECIHLELKNMTSLIFLSLQSNFIKTVEPRIFSQLESLTILSISNNHLNDTMIKRINLMNLNTLILSKNPIFNLTWGVFMELSRLQFLTMTQSKIEFIEAGIFKNLVNLQSIDLSFNHLSVLRKHYFEHTVSIRTITLSFNVISSIEADSFMNNKLLSNLYMAKNLLKTIPDGLFSNLTYLTLVDLSYNQIEIIPSGFIHDLPVLKSINLEGNLIKRFEKKSFFNLPKLRELKLARNRIKQIERFYFNGLASLRTIDLDYNRIESVETGSFSDLTDAAQIVITNNYLSSIEMNAFEDMKSHLVDLSGNQLDNFNSFVYKNSTVEVLNLERNNLVALESSSLEHLISTKELHLGFNKLGSISNELFGKSDANLERLYLQNNFISSCEFLEGNKFYNLIEIDLSFNSIEKILDSQFRSLKNLTSLSISNNPIKVMESEVFRNLNIRFLNVLNVSFQWSFYLTKLEGINLGMNHLEDLDFLQLENIKELYLVQCGLDLNKIDFSKALSLKYLDLSGNQDDGVFKIERREFLENLVLTKMNIKSLDRFRFFEFKKLKLLDLSYNQVTEIRREYFKKLEDLEYLDLSYNRISWIEEGSFDDILNDFYKTTEFGFLNLSNNNIKHLKMRPMINAVSLRLENNLEMKDLKIIQTRNSNFQWLEELVISNSILEYIPLVEMFDKQGLLKTLVLNQNRQEKTTRNMFSNLPELKHLDLASNQISNIEYGSFNTLDKLEFLALSDNRISTIDQELFSNLFHLTTLNLSLNYIEYFNPTLFADLFNLVTLDLSFNRLKYIDDHSFKDLGLLQHLYLNTNETRLKLSMNSLSGLKSIVDIYMSVEHLFEAGNRECLKGSLSPRVEKPVGDLKYYKSINILSHMDESKWSERYCHVVIEFVRMNIQVNLKSDYQFVTFLAHCLNIDLFYIPV